MRSNAFHKRLLPAALACLALALSCLAIPAGAGALTIPSVTEPVKGINKIVVLAKAELAKRAAERRSDNVPRYHQGKGRVAPYSIGDAWCAAFSTWVWNHAGFDDYLGAGLIWKSKDKTPVAVQVTDLTRWAQKSGYFSFRARPGYLVAYGRTHIGIVQKVNRNGRAVASIEGNLSDSVTAVTVPMAEVTGYISPVRLSAGQSVSRRSVLADVG